MIQSIGGDCDDIVYHAYAPDPKVLEMIRKGKFRGSGASCECCILAASGEARNRMSYQGIHKTDIENLQLRCKTAVIRSDLWELFNKSCSCTFRDRGVSTIRVIGRDDWRRSLPPIAGCWVAKPCANKRHTKRGTPTLGMRPPCFPYFS